jgi:hypothetical protein
MIGENIVSIATTCKVKSIKMKISKSTWIYWLSKGHFDNVITMVIMLSINIATVTTITTMSKGMKVKFIGNF